MAHLLAPLETNAELPVFFNVNGVVGASPAENRREDVLLVQFLFKMVADRPPVNMIPEHRAIMRAVNVTGTCDSATIEAIKLVQTKKKAVNPGIIIDGRVSSAKGGYSYSGNAAWTIAIINDLAQDNNTDVWPRIDMAAGCPQELKDMVKRQVVGV